jgi:hypothetical protein
MRSGQHPPAQVVVPLKDRRDDMRPSAPFACPVCGLRLNLWEEIELQECNDPGRRTWSNHRALGARSPMNFNIDEMTR